MYWVLFINYTPNYIHYTWDKKQGTTQNRSERRHRIDFRVANHETDSTFICPILKFQHNKPTQLWGTMNVRWFRLLPYASNLYHFLLPQLTFWLPKPILIHGQWLPNTYIRCLNMNQPPTQGIRNTLLIFILIHDWINQPEVI